MLVEVLASRLEDNARHSFAAELPEQLQDIALSVFPALAQKRHDIVAQFMYYQNIGKTRAQKQIYAAWQALTDTISEAEVKQIKSVLAGDSSQFSIART